MADLLLKLLGSKSSTFSYADILHSNRTFVLFWSSSLKSPKYFLTLGVPLIHPVVRLQQKKAEARLELHRGCGVNDFEANTARLTLETLYNDGNFFKTTCVLLLHLHIR